MSTSISNYKIMFSNPLQHTFSESLLPAVASSKLYEWAFLIIKWGIIVIVLSHLFIYIGSNVDWGQIRGRINRSLFLTQTGEVYSHYEIGDEPWRL